jgi:hypothetical protein
MRKFLLLFLVVAVSLGAETPRFNTVRGFEKGLNNHSSEFLTPDNQATVANNVRFNTGYGELGKRPFMIQYGTTGGAAINSMWRYYKSDGTKKLVIATSTLLRVGDDAAGVFQTIKSGLSDGKQWAFITYKDIMIGMNGFNRPIKYDGKIAVTDDADGHRTDGILCAELGAPFAELNVGANLDATSWYMYKVAFYDGATYSYSEARSNAILTGGAVQDIRLTDIPIGPIGTTQRIIYRTSGHVSQAAVEATATYYRVVTIADNSTTVYNDAIDDTTIEADTAPTWATVSAGTEVSPPMGSIAVVSREKLFITGNKTFTSDIYWSDTFNPQYFHPNDYRPIRPDDGDAVTFLKTQLGILVIGKTTTIQKFYTEAADSDNWVVSEPFSYVGCIAQYSASTSPLGIIYLGRDGLYAFTGQSSQLLSDPVKPVIDDILVTNVQFVTGIWFKNEYHMAYTSVLSGELSNNRVLVLDTIRTAYNIDTKKINSFASLSSGDDFGILYMGSSEADGIVWANEEKPLILSKRLKSEFDLGTYDDVATYGEETNPSIELAWDVITDALGGITDDKIGITDRPDTDGTWLSPVYEVNADTLDLLFWNEDLQLGDITWDVRTGPVAVVDGSWTAFSGAFTNPNGSDLSSINGDRYIQFRINLTTTNIISTPKLFFTNGFVFKTTYSKVGNLKESPFLSEWASGFKELGLEGHQKFIRRIKVFYTGTSGTMTVNYSNERGTADRTFTIDLATTATVDTKDPYTGNDTQKVYTHFPAINTSTNPAPVGQFFKFYTSENGIISWGIDRIEVMYFPEEISNV